MPTEYERLAEIEEHEYRTTLEHLNNMERQAKDRGFQRALADFKKQNEEGALTDDSKQ